jgi:hypothetical protein
MIFRDKKNIWGVGGAGMTGNAAGFNINYRCVHGNLLS